MKRYDVALLFALSFLIAACIDEPCDDDQIYLNGRCVAAPSMPSGMADAATQNPADAGGDAQGEPVKYSGFGDVCSDAVKHSDCTQDADHCGKVMPTDPTGQCTKIDCLDDPSRCPPTWSCVDITKFVPDSDVKSACIPPTGM